MLYSVPMKRISNCSSYFPPQKTSLSEMVDDLEEVEMTLRTKVKGLENSEALLRDRVSDLERDLEASSSRVTQLEQTSEALGERAQTMDDERRQLTSQVDDLRCTCEEASKDVERLKEQVREMLINGMKRNLLLLLWFSWQVRASGEQCDASEKQRLQLETEVKELTQKCDAMTSQLQDRDVNEQTEKPDETKQTDVREILSSRISRTGFCS